MSLLTMTDCTEEANRVQALHELDRAMTSGVASNGSLWAAKWGRSLIEAARGAVDEEQVAAEIRQAETEATQAEAERDDLQSAIDKAINALDEIESDDETRRAIDAAVAILENA